MDVLMPDGTLIKNVPEGTTKAQLQAKLSGTSAPQGGNIINTDVPTVVGEVPNPAPIAEPKRSMADYVKALYEVPATVASGAIAQPVGAAYGVYKGMTSPEYGTQQGVQQGQQAGAELAQKLQFQPTSPVSQDVLQGVSSVMEATKIPVTPGGIGQLPSFAKQMGNVAQFTRPMVQETMQTAKPAVANMAQALRKETPTMSGVGAAQVPEAAVRAQMAQQLRVPVELSKGQAMRDLGQQKFEIETPKNFPELGKPLIEAQAKRNDAILQNFDAYVDATGKETFGLRETGKVVDRALVNQANKAKQQINAAYEKARVSGETQEPVNYTPLTSYIEKQTPTVRAKLAPILDAVDEQVKINDTNKTGQIALNNLEDVYQFINRNYDPSDKVASVHVKEMKNIINQMTEGVGGENYQAARALRAKFGREFENIGAVDKLLRTKKGTDDRAVAFEDVFKHAILDGSRDDVAAIGLTLKKGGAEGQQAWKELQGQTIQHLKEKVTQAVDVDSFGNPVVSPAKFKSAIREIDQDGKLDYVFGKKGAQEIRDLLETTINVNAPLKGAANYSNTSSAIITALDKINQTPLGKIPGIGSASKFVVEKGKESALKKQIQESINYAPENMANELRKGNK
jgi:hypothetical protein